MRERRCRGQAQAMEAIKGIQPQGKQTLRPPAWMPLIFPVSAFQLNVCPVSLSHPSPSPTAPFSPTSCPPLPALQDLATSASSCARASVRLTPLSSWHSALPSTPSHLLFSSLRCVRLEQGPWSLVPQAAATWMQGCGGACGRSGV
jgi:hypothetical protein